ncbi:hypothetical protein DDE05_58375 [Streptomyces cavourensis]|nr:hypothetical protein DDE05_58375 [Streptomyces cavourensis]
MPALPLTTSPGLASLDSSEPFMPFSLACMSFRAPVSSLRFCTSSIWLLSWLSSSLVRSDCTIIRAVSISMLERSI